MALRRLFFALWPDDQVRARLFETATALHADCGGRLTKRDKLHQTLVFLGDVAQQRIADLEDVGAEVTVPAFLLQFGITGYWRHNRIAWVAPRAVPEPLLALVGLLEDALQHADFDFDRRDRDYAPHVTLVRNARAPRALPAVACNWTIDEYALVESVRDLAGAGYRVLARWKLGGAPSQ